MNKPITKGPLRDTMSDQLEVLARQMRIVHFRYQKTEQDVKDVFGIVKNLYSIKKEKYVLLSGGEEIKVNSIVSMAV